MSLSVVITNAAISCYHAREREKAVDTILFINQHAGNRLIAAKSSYDVFALADPA
jgi:hypothetical protein